MRKGKHGTMFGDRFCTYGNDKTNSQKFVGSVINQFPLLPTSNCMEREREWGEERQMNSIMAILFTFAILLGGNKIANNFNSQLVGSLIL